MRRNVFVKHMGFVFFFLTLAAYMFAQDGKIDNWRPNDQTGINIFEAPKTPDASFDGLKVRIGGAFAQQYQSLKHSNNPDASVTDLLYPLAPGFNLATANLNIDVQLEDGIRLAVENYMSSRHHQEFWVKGGYIQVDKLPMFGNPDWFSKYLRVKIGHFQVNYGDQQFRRTDNGNAIFNPFIGNYIMDAFATEIGSEAYLFLPGGITGMVGMTSGQIKGDIKEGDNRAASIYAKLAFDKQINDDFRFRLSGSVYNNPASARNTLYGGDRSGSRFYLVMENDQASTSGNAFSGRINPGFTTKVTSFQINPFVKFQGLEVFATYEMSKGYASNDPKSEGADNPESREATQVAVEGIYRFLKNEQLFVGARYNTVKGGLHKSLTEDAAVNRLEIAAGWYPVKNLLLKGAYVNQQYVDWPSTNFYHDGEFKGVMIEAVVGF